MTMLIAVLIALFIAEIVDACTKRKVDEGETSSVSTQSYENVRYIYPTTQLKQHTPLTVKGGENVNRPRDKITPAEFRREYKQWKKSLDDYTKLRSTLIK